MWRDQVRDVEDYFDLLFYIFFTAVFVLTCSSYIQNIFLNVLNYEQGLNTHFFLTML